MNTIRPSWGRVLGWFLVLLLATAPPASAQTDVAATSSGPPWGIIGAVGFGGLGLGLGVLAALDMRSDDFGPSGAALVTITGTTLLGTWTGARIGGRARRMHAQEESLHPFHQAALVTGSILAGATLGAAASVPLINPGGEGTFLGSDERTFALLATGGGALGALYAGRHWDRIRGSKVRISPGLRGPGQYSLYMQIPF